MKNLIHNDKIFLLAEIAQSYEGNVDTLLEISEKACEAGVDGVMFQVVYADELVVPNYSLYDFFQSLKLPEENWKQVINTIHNNGKLAVGEVFGKYSADLMHDLGIDCLKIHAADLSNLPLLRHIGSFDLPVLLSIGGAFDKEISAAIKALKETGNPEIVLLHGYQKCPTSIPDTNFFKMKELEDQFGLSVGYSDHIAGCNDNDIKSINELSYYFPLIALGAGARLIEKHIILDRTKAWEDYESALTVEEFQRFINLIRIAEASLGTKSLALNEAEHSYRIPAKKYIVANQDIPKNTMLSENLIAFKRIQNPDEGLPNIEDIIGKKVQQDLKVNDTINNNILY